MKIIHINASDVFGGAARAAYRIHRSIVDHGAAHGFRSQMRVINRLTDDPSVLAGRPISSRPFLSRVYQRMIRASYQGFQTANPSLHSIALTRTGLGRELTAAQLNGSTDLVHLHWLGDYTLSIEEIGCLPGPTVWTLHDQWPFCGAEHYTYLQHDTENQEIDERFITGYNSSNRPSHESGPDMSRKTWLRKKRAWKDPIHIVATTRWLADCARKSVLMHDWPITTIPYPLNLDVWKPVDQNQARKLLDLPVDRPLILFGAIGGTKDPRKGADLLLEALKRLRPRIQGTSLDSMELVVFGEGPPAKPHQIGFPIHYRGRLQDDLSLRLHYAAADVMVVPSRQEAFGQTASEAQACGTPVVCFATGGLIDVVENGETGLWAEPFDPTSLAEAIKSVCTDSERRKMMGNSAHLRASKLWDSKRIYSSYRCLYEQIRRA
jgi:glycosyltransferase involved in cell wall biosynthesis